MTIQEYITLAETIGKDFAAVLGSLGALATVVAHLPNLPARWAEFFARFASYTSQSFSVNKREPQKPDAPPHITIAPAPAEPEPPAAAMRGALALMLATMVLAPFACSPAANQKAEDATKSALECLASPPVQDCLKGLVCSGPDKQCAIALAVYKSSCLELCGAPDAGSD